MSYLASGGLRDEASGNGTKRPESERTRLNTRVESRTTGAMAEISRTTFFTWLNSGGRLRVPYFDLSGLDLRGVYFSNANLKGANFEGANLEGAKR